MIAGLSAPTQRSSAASVGRGCVRVPLDLMERSGLNAGDTVAFTMARTTHARVVPMTRGQAAVVVHDQVLINAEGNDGDNAHLERANLPPLASVILHAEGVMPQDTSGLSEELFDVAVSEGDVIEVGGQSMRFRIASVSPGKAGLCTEHTALSFRSSPDQSGYDGVGGLEDQISRLNEMVAAPLLRPDLFERLGIKPPRGVLFVGPPGSGKTLLARAVAAKTSAAFFQLNGPEIVSKHYGESEAALRSIFAAAQRDQPAIIFIDEIDAIAPKRDVLSGEKQVERRIVAQLLTLMDGLGDRGNVVVMAATNLPDSLDSALRRPGRFDREIAFTPPDADQRADIMKIHLRDAPLAPDVDLSALAQTCHGYVGADLAALAREASLAALQRVIGEAGGEAHVDPEKLFVTQSDLLSGKNATMPSILREAHVDNSPIRWTDIGGLEDEKQALTEAVMWPLKHADTFASMRVTPSRGILLSGPAGGGKTLMARALAQESGMNFLPVRPSRIISQYLGEAERAVADVFARARQSAPTLIFFDELDGLAPRRGGKDAVVDRIVTQLLAEMDGLNPNTGIVVLGATNRPVAIDPALTRAGRFDLVIPLPMPDRTARQAIIKVHLAGRPISDEVDIDLIADQTEGNSGADLANLVEIAARRSLRRIVMGAESEPMITRADFVAALATNQISNLARIDDHIVEGAN